MGRHSQRWARYTPPVPILEGIIMGPHDWHAMMIREQGRDDLVGDINLRTGRQYDADLARVRALWPTMEIHEVPMGLVATVRGATFIKTAIFPNAMNDHLTSWTADLPDPASDKYSANDLDYLLERIQGVLDLQMLPPDIQHALLEFGNQVLMYRGRKGTGYLA